MAKKQASPSRSGRGGRCYKIDMAPYPGTLYFTTSMNKFIEVCKKHLDTKIDPDSDLWDGQCFSNETDFAVWAKDVPSLIHELNHVVLDLFDKIGINPQEASGEPYCYMFDMILEKCLKKIKKDLTNV